MRPQIVLVLSAYLCASTVNAQTTVAQESLQSKSSAQTQPPPEAQTKSELNTFPQRGSVKRQLNETLQRAVNAGAQTKRSATPADRLDLETTVVSGNRELPKVLYIVPWKRADLGELPAQPFNTLLDEALAPVDRDVFKREVKYFHAVDGAGK